MIIVMKRGFEAEELNSILRKAEELGFQTHPIVGEEKTVIGVIGIKDIHKVKALEIMPGVEKIVEITEPYKLVGRSVYKDDAIVDVDGVKVGGEEIVVMAGPCSVEGMEQIRQVASCLKENGAQVIRGGAFKPRSSPYSFQGMGKEGLEILARAREEFGVKIVTEVMDTRTVDLVAEYADLLQVGARNMQNFVLLKELGRCKKPVLLKRGLSATIEEWLMAAEYVASEGNQQIILCERGIRTFERATRNTLDLSAVPVLKEKSRFPVIVDPSHGTGKRDYVASMARAAIAAGADGLMVEIHPDPNNAWSDGEQSLNLDMFSQLMKELGPIAAAVGKKLKRPVPA